MMSARPWSPLGSSRFRQVIGSSQIQDRHVKTRQLWLGSLTFLSKGVYPHDNVRGVLFSHYKYGQLCDYKGQKKNPMLVRKYLNGVEMTKCNSDINEDLLEYGEVISQYHGKGDLTIPYGSGEKKYNCFFNVGQFGNGDIILLCHNLPQHIEFALMSSNFRAKTFEGKTDDGSLIYINDLGNLYQTSYRSKLSNNTLDVSVAFHSRELKVIKSNSGWFKVHFGITNFKFDEGQGKHQSNDKISIILQNNGNKTEFDIRKINNYEAIIDRISSFRTIGVTGEIITNIQGEHELAELTKLISDICYLLSVKNGTKISWVYYYIYDKNGECVFKEHARKVTKIYQQIGIFFFDLGKSVGTKEFLEETYPHYIKHCISLKLNKGMIDTYLDAKAEADFLEIRGGKLALALEKLKYEYLKSKGKGSEYIFPENAFERVIIPLSFQVKSILKENGLNKDMKTIESVSDKNKIKGLNYKSFSNVLKELSKDYQLELKSDERNLFIQCRNSLVHRGDFYFKTAEPEEIKKCHPLPSKKYEFFFLVNMLDRIFLKILVQDDQSIRINWRKPPKFILNWLK